MDVVNASWMIIAETIGKIEKRLSALKETRDSEECVRITQTIFLDLSEIVSALGAVMACEVLTEKEAVIENA